MYLVKTAEFKIWLISWFNWIVYGGGRLVLWVQNLAQSIMKFSLEAPVRVTFILNVYVNVFVTSRLTGDCLWCILMKDNLFTSETEIWQNHCHNYIVTKEKGVNVSTFDLWKQNLQNLLLACIGALKWLEAQCDRTSIFCKLVNWWVSISNVSSVNLIWYVTGFTVARHACI